MLLPVTAVPSADTLQEILITEPRHATSHIHQDYLVTLGMSHMGLWASALQGVFSSVKVSVGSRQSLVGPGTASSVQRLGDPAYLRLAALPSQPPPPWPLPEGTRRVAADGLSPLSDVLFCLWHVLL